MCITRIGRRMALYQESQYVRVVKEADSKSAGFSRAGSNPAADAFFIFDILPIY